MMRNRFLTILACTALALYSCDKDKGNYSYDDTEKITITGIAAEYPVVQSVDKLNISPEVKSNKEGAEFDYVYFIYDVNKGSEKPDTLSVGSKDLKDVVIGAESGKYAFIFKATNKKTNVSAFYNATLNVSTRFNNGWYVLKSEAGKTDMDYFNLTNEKIENVILSVNGRQLDGDVAMRIGVNDNYADPTKFNETYKTFDKTRVLIPIANKDAKAIKLSTGKILNDFSAMYLDEPKAPYGPSMYVASMQGQWMLNNGRGNFIFSYSSMLSKFGPEYGMTNEFKDYYLSKYVVSNGIYDPIAFDELSSSFVAMPASQTYLMSIADAAGTQLSAKNNNMKLVFAGAKALYDDYFYAVLQDKSNLQTKYVADISGIGGKNFKILLDKLQPTDPAFNAEIFTLNHSLTKAMYFVSNNKVYVRNVAGIPGRNTDLNVNIPAGERPTMLKHVKHLTQFDYLIVGTTAGGNYKVYFYKLNSVGELASNQPDKVLEGRGAVGDISYVFPAVSQTTFPLTY